MTSDLHCYRCGVALTALTPPIGRGDTCPSCRVDLRVCLMCTAYDANVARQCNEDDAEDVHEKARANFCDFFAPNPDAHTPGQMTAQQRAEAALAALFDDAGETRSAGPADGGQSTLRDAEALFKS